MADQQVTNLIHHLKTCHGVSREEVDSSHLPVETPPFPGTLIPFVLQAFVADRCQYIEVHL